MWIEYEESRVGSMCKEERKTEIRE